MPLAREIKLAGRRLAAAPATTAALGLTLALGVGATMAVFSVLDPLVLQKLPVLAPDELVLLQGAGTLGSEDVVDWSTAEYDRTRTDLFQAVAWEEGARDLTVTTGGPALALRGDAVSPNFFPFLGLAPASGRLGLTSDEGTHTVGVVLDFACWDRVFHRDAAAIGHLVMVGARPATIIGVAPPSFFGLTVGDRPDLYLVGGTTTPTWVYLFGRLQPGESPASVVTALTPSFAQVAGTTLPEVERQQEMARPAVTSIRRGLSDRRASLVRPAWAVMAMVALLMLVAATNVANVLTARDVARDTDVAIRQALGASRAAAALPGAIESVGVAGFGTMVGLGLGRLGTRWLLGTLTSTFGLTVEPDSAWHTGLVGLGLFTLAAGLGAALPLARRRSDVVDAIRPVGRLGRPRTRSLQHALAVAQVAASVTLVGTAGLLVHSLVNLESTNPGFDADRVLAIGLADANPARTPAAGAAYVASLRTRLEAVPGVRETSLANLVPFSGDVIGVNLAVAGPVSGTPAPSVKAFFASVTSNYFDTMGIAVRLGRPFQASDEAPTEPAVILNETAARQLFGTASPVGERVRFVEGRRPAMTIVGVVADSHYLDLRETTPNYAYLLRSSTAGLARSTVLARIGPGTSSAIGARLTAVAASLDSQVTVTGARSLRLSVNQSFAVDRAVAWLGSVLSSVALVVATVGLYALLSVVVAERTREIGLRMALGASLSHIVGLVGRLGASLVGGGLLVGAAGCAAGRALLASELYQVAHVDGRTILAVAVAMTIAALGACALPARLAVRVDPAAVLRRD